MYNWVDVLWLGGGRPFAALDASWQRLFHLDLKTGRDGLPQLSLTHRF